MPYFIFDTTEFENENTEGGHTKEEVEKFLHDHARIEGESYTVVQGEIVEVSVERTFRSNIIASRSSGARAKPTSDTPACPRRNATR